MRKPTLLSLTTLLALSACSGASPPMAAFHAATSGTKRAATAAAATDRKLVRTADVRLEVDDEDELEPTARALVSLAEKLGGYAVEQSPTRVVLKVPSDQIDRTLTEVEALAEVVEKNVRVVDVTDTHGDLTVQIDNARRLQARLRELVTQSASVTEVLAVEKELARVTSELEVLEGRLARMDKQVAYATLTFYLAEEVSPGPIGWVFYGLYRGVKWLFVWD